MFTYKWVCVCVNRILLQLSVCMSVSVFTIRCMCFSLYPCRRYYCDFATGRFIRRALLTPRDDSSAFDARNGFTIK